MMATRVRFALLPLVLAIACGDDGNRGAPRDAAPQPDASTEPPCVQNPTTYLEIINACTDAVKIYKDSHPPLLNPDGTLPPLP